MQLDPENSNEEILENFHFIFIHFHFSLRQKSLL